MRQLQLKLQLLPQTITSAASLGTTVKIKKLLLHEIELKLKNALPLKCDLCQMFVSVLGCMYVCVDVQVLWRLRLLFTNWPYELRI